MLYLLFLLFLLYLLFILDLNAPVLYLFILASTKSFELADKKSRESKTKIKTKSKEPNNYNKSTNLDWVGASVTIHGLNPRTDLNGAAGIVENEVSIGRLRVRLLATQ
jgi:hypothetical protein